MDQRPTIHHRTKAAIGREREAKRNYASKEIDFLRDRRLSLIFDRLRDASCIIDIGERMVSLFNFPFFYPVTTNFSFFLPTLKNTREIRCER